MAEQGKIIGFLANAGDAQKIDALTEDIHEALVEYQVCTRNYSLSITSDALRQTSLQQDIYGDGHRLIVSLTLASCPRGLIDG